VEQSAADAAAGLGEVVGGEGRTIVAVIARRNTVGRDGIAEGVEKVGGVLGEGEARTDGDPAMVIDDGAEDGFALALGGGDLGSVHEVTDPEVVGVGHLVLGAGSCRPADGLVETSGFEEAPEGGLTEASPLGEDPIVVKDLMEELDGDFPMLDAVAGDDLGGVVVEASEGALVGACLG
jgi:hypothetical protein